MNNDLISRKYIQEQISKLNSYDDAIDIWLKRDDVDNLINNAPTVEIPTELCKGCRFFKDCETCEEKLRPQGGAV